MYSVVTDAGKGIQVYESDNKEICKQYIEQAIKKGSNPEFLAVKEGGHSDDDSNDVPRSTNSKAADRN